MRIVVLLGAAFFLAAAAPAPVPEPSGLFDGPMRGDTPNTLKGATVVDAKTVALMREHDHLLLIDVAEMDKRPPSMAPDMLWMPTHRSLPGAVWLVAGGFGTSDPGYAAAFETRVAALANHDLDRQIVVFCHPHCWGSWNAAKRLVRLGYKHVYWYPDGVEGWQSSGYDTVVMKPDLEWQKARARERQGKENQVGERVN